VASGTYGGLDEAEHETRPCDGGQRDGFGGFFVARSRLKSGPEETNQPDGGKTREEKQECQGRVNVSKDQRNKLAAVASGPQPIETRK
jgi:hypothetical protein